MPKKTDLSGAGGKRILSFSLLLLKNLFVEEKN